MYKVGDKVILKTLINFPDDEDRNWAYFQGLKTGQSYIIEDIINDIRTNNKFFVIKNELGPIYQLAKRFKKQTKNHLPSWW